MSQTEGSRGGITATISNSAVRLLHEYTGRGPTKARTIVNGDTVMILLGDTLTKGEKVLAESGGADAVMQMRHRFQLAMRDELIRAVESATNRKVVAFMSANHIDPDLAAEVFVLEPSGDSESSVLREGDA